LINIGGIVFEEEVILMQRNPLWKPRKWYLNQSLKED
jgi:hypothetical protein